MATGWWQRLREGAARAVGPRVAGDPPSANGASSFHLRWDLAGRFRSVAVTLEVLEPPTVDRLYFWALQGDFVDDAGRPAGGAHLGLQWYPPHPGSTAVNWGGYDAGGRILDGTASPLPSATGNVNTRDLAWEPRRAYRLAVTRTDPVAGDPPGMVRWSGSVTDDAGRVVVVRDLFVADGWISGAVMWSEVFARCDHPSVAVRWSHPAAITAEGREVTPRSVSLTYQTHENGGCFNTNSGVDGVGMVQTTSTVRENPHQSVLTVPS